MAVPETSAPVKAFRYVRRMNVPGDLRYTSDHEWVRQEGTRLRVGITDYAQEALGDIVFVQLPETGTRYDSGQSLSEVESTKSVSDVSSPLAGTVVEVNDTVAESPDLLNSDPYGAGWICIIEPDDPEATATLLDAEGYSSLVAG